MPTASPAAAPSSAPFWRHTPSADPARCAIALDPTRIAEQPVHAHLYGKFCEHLGHNIYQGMEAQILLNPTFGRWRFFVGEDNLDGGAAGEYDPAKAMEHARGYLKRWYGAADEAVIEDYGDGAAFPWFRLGSKREVTLSPDVGPHGGRAQRVETFAPARGLAQRTWLPLHRTRRYRFRAAARATRPLEAALTLAAIVGDAVHAPLATARLPLGEDWRTIEGELAIPPDAAIDADGLYQLAVVLPSDANVVLGRVLLYPDDHVGFADPEIIRMFTESRLPLLRWPGGNFVSGYRWRDGVGPVDQRPTLANPAWMGLEHNFFGTAEFVAWCRAVGCEPMICVNAGDGSPEEAAAWVEYCNGAASTPMGRLRAEHGHPEPFAIRLWEVGNELWGRWQVSWTTPGGKADRYRRFAQAMRAADPGITLLGTGCWWWPDNAWDQRMLAEGGATLRSLTDHILTGGRVDRTVRAADLYHAFTAQAESLAAKYVTIREAMAAAGIREPRLAITELQVFARFDDTTEPAVPGGLERATMPHPGAMIEAQYFTTIAHACIRLGSFVEMITHSATVNHGGGLRKARERTWANPVHWAHWLGAALVGGRPVAVAWSSATTSIERGFDRMPPLKDVPAVDVMAVRHDDGSLVVMLVHRSADVGAIRVALDLGRATAATRGELHLLAAATYHDENPRTDPDRIRPVASSVGVRDGRCEIGLPPFAVARLAVPAR